MHPQMVPPNCDRWFGHQLVNCDSLRFENEIPQFVFHLWHQFICNEDIRLRWIAVGIPKPSADSQAVNQLVF